MIPPASLKGGDRRIVLETIFKVDKREPEGGPYLSDKSVSPPRKGAGGREAKDHLETAEGEGEGGPYLSDNSGPPSKEDRQTS